MVSKISRFCFSIILVALMLTTGCYYKSYKDMEVGKEVPMEMATFSSGQANRPFDRFPQYRIVPGDVLDVLYQIQSWKKQETFRIAIDHTITVKFMHIPEMTETQKVRPDGKITLPYLGDVDVVGKTPAELKGELMKSYAKTFQSPELNVLIPEFRASILDFKNDLHTAPRGLSRLATVRPDGYVTFPLIGDIFVADQTVPEVNKLMNQMYEKVMPDLHCDLFLEHHAGSVVYIAGQVRSPGSYVIKKPISILEAITLAGGSLYGAKLESVIAIRKIDKVMTATKIDLSKNLEFDEKASFFYLQPNDIIYVPTTLIYSAAEVARSIGDIIYFRGWSVNASLAWQLYSAPQSNSTTTTTTTNTP